MKKRIPYIFGLSMLCLSAIAQIPKGTSTIGGSISGSYQESKSEGSANKDKETYIGIQPTYGYFIINNLAIGATVEASLNRYGSDRKYGTQELNRETLSFGVGPHVTYYLPINAKLYAHAVASYQWSWSESTYETTYDGINLSDNEYTGRSGYWGVGAGLSYFLTPNAALEATVGYDHKKDLPYEYRDEVNVFPPYTQKTGSLVLGIGFRIFLRKAS